MYKEKRTKSELKNAKNKKNIEFFLNFHNFQITKMMGTTYGYLRVINITFQIIDKWKAAEYETEYEAS